MLTRMGLDKVTERETSLYLGNREICQRQCGQYTQIKKLELGRGRELRTWKGNTCIPILAPPLTSRLTRGAFTFLSRGVLVC